MGEVPVVTLGLRGFWLKSNEKAYIHAVVCNIEPAGRTFDDASVFYDVH